jgi:hypothetical protein
MPVLLTLDKAAANRRLATMAGNEQIIGYAQLLALVPA